MKNRKAHPLRVAIANDHHLICDGLRFILAGSPEVEVVGVVENAPALIRLVGELEPDVLLVDPFMHNQPMLKTLTWVHGEWPQIAIIALSPHDDADHIRMACQAGARSYLTLCVKRETLLQAITSAFRGEALLQPDLLDTLTTSSRRTDSTGADSPQPPLSPSLSPREVSILQRVSLGERNKEIAAFLSISEPTVKTHLANIYAKLGVDSRASAITIALQNNLLLLPQSP